MLRFFDEKPDIVYSLRTTSKGLYFRLIFLLNFFLIFVLFFRFFNLFRKKNVIDLNIIVNKLISYDKITLVLFVVLVIIAIKNFMFFFKITFLRVHFYLMHPNNFKYFDEYSGFVYKFSTWHNRFILYFLLKEVYWFHFNRKGIYFLLKYGFTLILVLTFFLELLLNNYNLEYFVMILPWYSLYKLLYGFNSFIIYNMDYLYDLVVSGSIYSVDESLHYRIYHEYDLENQGQLFVALAPKDYCLSTDEFRAVREYIRKNYLIEKKII